MGTTTLQSSYPSSLPTRREGVGVVASARQQVPLGGGEVAEREDPVADRAGHRLEHLREAGDGGDHALGAERAVEDLGGDQDDQGSGASRSPPSSAAARPSS